LVVFIDIMGVPNAGVVSLVVFIDVMGVPNAGVVSLAPKPKLGVVVANAKPDTEGDIVAVVVKGPNAVLVAVLVIGTKLGTCVFDVVAPTVSILLILEPNVNPGQATGFSAVPNAFANTEGLAHFLKVNPPIVTLEFVEPKLNTLDAVVTVAVAVQVPTAKPVLFLAVMAAVVLLPNVACDEVKPVLGTEAAGSTKLMLTSVEAVSSKVAPKRKSDFALCTISVDVLGFSLVQLLPLNENMTLFATSSLTSDDGRFFGTPPDSFWS
jgi:hypothetical protein